jgi:hypothetical protein
MNTLLPCRAGAVAITKTLALAFLGSLAAPADVVTLQFGGTVTSVYSPTGAVPTSLIQVGDPVQISVRYDTTTPDYRPDANWGGYNSSGWLKVQIRDMAFERTSGINVEVLNGANGNQHLFQVMGEGPTSAWPQELSGFDERRMMLGVWETQAPIDLLAGPGLPTSLDVTRADYAIGEIGVSSANLNMFTAQFRLSMIPEPGTASLLLLGGICWLLTSTTKSRLGSPGLRNT